MPEDQTARQDPRAEFINVSVWHGSLDRAQEILAEHPEVARSDIHTAAVLGDHEAVGRFLTADTANATAKGGPRNWDALTHLCFSKFLRLARSSGSACHGGARSARGGCPTAASWTGAE
jgi:hypothetical protein